MTKRIILNIDEQNRLIDLMKYYRDCRDIQLIYDRNAKEASIQILDIFKKHGIIQKQYSNCLFKIQTRIKYNIPKSIMDKVHNMKNVTKKETETLIMYRKKSYPQLPH